MKRIYAIATNTFREAIRDHVLFGTLAFTVAVLFFTLALAQLSLNEELRVIYDIGLSVISLSTVVVTIVLGSSLLYKEIERKTLYVILPKPISRTEFLLGKYFGILLTTLVFVATMGAVLGLLMTFHKGTHNTQLCVVVLGFALMLATVRLRGLDWTTFLLPWSLAACAVSIWLTHLALVDFKTLIYALVLVFGEGMVVTAVALVFSAFSTPFLTGLLTFGVWLVGRDADSMATMKSNVLSQEIKIALRWISEIVPNLNLFAPHRQALEDTVASNVSGVEVLGYLGSSMGYAVLYCLLLLGLAALLFRQREFI